MARGIERGMVELLVEVEVEVVEVVTGKTLVFDLFLSAMTRCANFFENPTTGGVRPVWGAKERRGVARGQDPGRLGTTAASSNKAAGQKKVRLRPGGKGCNAQCQRSKQQKQNR